MTIEVGHESKILEQLSQFLEDLDHNLNKRHIQEVRKEILSFDYTFVREAYREDDWTYNVRRFQTICN